MTPPTDRPADSPAVIQLLVSDQGNRRAVRSMLQPHHEVRVERSVEEADLYLVEDRLLSTYREELRARTEPTDAVFSPVVVIRRETTDLDWIWPDPLEQDTPPLVDDVVDAPIDEDLLRRRLHSLLVRRRQSETVRTQMATIEERQRELYRFERGFESSDNALALLDDGGTIEVVNPALTELSGYPEERLLGASVRLLQPAGAPEVFDEEFWRTVDRRDRWSGEIVVERSDGSRRVADVTISDIDSEGSVTSGFVLVLNDVTEHIRRERELEDREEQLELLRQVLTRYLRHNLRNDLTVVRGQARQIAEGRSEADARERAASIVDRTDRLLEKSSTARTYSDLLAGESRLSRRDLSALLEAAVEAVRRGAGDADIELDAPDSCPIRAGDGIGVALEELIENAVQHNPAETPTVRIRVSQTRGARVEIEDDGPGIPDVELRTLAVEEETPLTHSQGIGLWLSKWLIEDADGRMAFDATETGTRVVLEFPPPDEVGEEGLDVPALKERDQRLETIIDRVTDAVVQVDADWAVTFLDRRAEEILDADVESAIDRSLWEVFPGGRGTGVEETCRRVMNTRSAETVTDRIEPFDAWLAVDVYPEFDGGLSLYVRDVTDRQRRERDLRAARERMELALDATGATIWEWNLDTDRVTTHPAVHTVIDDEVETVADFVDPIHPADRERVREALETAVETGRDYHEQFRVRVDGETRWVEDHGRIGTRGDDGARRLLGINRDITERVERTRDLQERVKELTAVHEVADVLARTDLSLADALGAFVDSIPESFQQPALTEARITYDDTAVSTDGFESAPLGLSAERAVGDSTIELEVVYLGEPDTAGSSVFVPEERDLLDTLVSIVASDVERRSSRSERRRLQELFASAERIADMGAWEVNVDTETVYWTEGARRIYEYHDGAESTLERAIEFVRPEYRDDLRGAVAESLDTGDRFELDVEIRTTSGEDKWVHFEGRPADRDDEHRWLEGVIQDVTERTVRERDLRRSQDLLRHTEQLAGTGGWEADVESGRQRWTAGTYRIHDISPGSGFEPTVDAGVEFYHPDDRAEIDRAVRRCMEAGESYEVELRLITAEDRTRWVLATGEAIEAAGEIVAVRGAISDITERKRREQALARQRTLLEAQQESVLDGMVVVDEDGRVVSYNERFVDMWELPPDLVADGDGDRVFEALADRLERPAPLRERIASLSERPEDTSRDEVALVDGRIFDRYTTPLTGDDGTYYGRLWTFRDVTDRVQRAP
jgi:PAS domain S-box-containing protein